MGLFGNKKKKDDGDSLTQFPTTTTTERTRGGSGSGSGTNSGKMKFYENGEEDEELLKQQALKHLTKGCAIDDSLKESTVDVENDFGGASSEENQLEASPITVYATEYQESNAIKIAANETFCCYGIRNGLVRVLSQVSQSRSLLRGHETPIASMSFLPSTNEEESILATLSEDGTLLVRRLNEDESSETISDSTLLKLDVSSEADNVSGTTTSNDSLIVPSFRWFPRKSSNDSKAEFLIAYGNAIFKSSVDLNEDAGGQSPIPFEERVDLDGPITSIDVINQRQVVATTEREASGSWALVVFELEPQGLGFTKTVEKHTGKQSSMGNCAARWMNENTLAVATAVNAGSGCTYIECLHYDKKTGTGLKTTQSIKIGCSSEWFWNSFQFARVGYKDKQCFLFADSKRNVVYALSVNEHESKFNYISQFSVSQPILSLLALDVSDEDDDVQSAQFGLFCMQTGAIQQLRLPMLDCVRLLPKGKSPSSTIAEQVQQELPSIITDAPPQRAASPVVSGLLTPDMFKKSMSQSASAEELAPSSPSVSDKPPPPIAQQQASKPAAAPVSVFAPPAVTTTEVAKLIRELKNEVKQDRDKLRKEREKRDNAERERQKQLIALMSQATTKDLPTAISQIVSEQLGENAAAVQAALATNAAASQRAAVAAAKEAVQTTLQSEIRQAMQQVMIPAFERSTQNMFNQIANTFERSIGELNNELMQIRDQSVQANAMPLVQELQRTVNEMRSLPQSLDSALKSSVSNAFRGMQQQSGPSQGMFQQQMPPRAGGGGGVRSLADLEQQKPPPQAPQDPTLEIKRLLNTGNLDAAFSSALGTSNLEIVSWLCSQVDPERVFGQHPCPLSPFVLLSLAQQLSSDLTTKDAERKLDWIRDTCLAIDPQDPALKLHVRPVLTAVYESLRKLGSSSQNISPSVKAAARLVVHVVNSLLSACP
jgi:enhancer of mRNA-decapping protein 4